MSFNVLISAIAHTSDPSSPCRGCVSDLSQVWCVRCGFADLFWCSQTAGQLSFQHYVSVKYRVVLSCTCSIVYSVDCTRNPNVLEKQPLLSYSADSLNFQLNRALEPLFHLNAKVQSSDIKQLSLLRSLRLQFNMYCEELWPPFADAPLYICPFICKNHVFSCFACWSFTAWMVVSFSVASKTEETRRSQREVRNARTHTRATIITNVLHQCLQWRAARFMAGEASVRLTNMSPPE